VPGNGRCLDLPLDVLHRGNEYVVYHDAFRVGEELHQVIQSIVDERLLDLRFPISFLVVSQVDCDHFLIIQFREIRNKELLKGALKGSPVISDAELQVIVLNAPDHGTETAGD
jgi:hypothetical protein